MRPTVFTAIAAVTVIALGVVLRMLGFFELQFWMDEAWWAMRLTDHQYGWIRPIGYMWVTGELLALGNNEQVLRSLSYLFGIAQLPLLYLVLRRVVTTPALAVVGTYALAIHPIAVAMTKEFKPYAVESCLHTVLVLLALAYCASSRARILVALVVVCAVGPLFAWTVVFAYPGVFSVVALTALRARRLGHVGIAVGGAVVTLAVLAGVFVARLADTASDNAGYWGKKYDVFYVGRGGFFDRVAWVLDKSAEVAAFPAQLHLPWPAGVMVLAPVVGAAVLAGIAALVHKKRWQHLGLLVLPWLVTLAFNLAGLWPYGLFRTNLFLLFYTIVLACIGVDAVFTVVRARMPRSRPWLYGVVLVMVALTAPFDVDYFRHKRAGTLTAEASVRTAMTTLKDIATREGSGPQRVLLDGHACKIYRYYRDYHDDARAELNEWYGAHASARCSRSSVRAYVKKLDEQKGSFWVIAAKGGLAKKTRERLAGRCIATHDEVLSETTLLYRCAPR